MSPDKGVAASRIGAVFFEGELKEPLGSLARPAARTIKLTYQCSKSTQEELKYSIN